MMRVEEGARSRPTWFASCLAVHLLHHPLSATFVPSSPLPRRSAAEVSSWFDAEFQTPLGYDPGALDALATEENDQCVLAALEHAPNPLSVSAVFREREGGRRYSFWIPHYSGPKLVTGRAHRHLAGRLLLPAIPRHLRRAFRPPAGHRYLLADLDRCFQVLLATAARDTTLLEAARRDLHQEAGDMMAPWLPADERRRLGKAFNSAVVGLISPEGWYGELHRRGVRATLTEAREMHRRWWTRFSGARQLRDAWIALHRRAAAQRDSLAIRYPDGRRYTFDAATVRGAARRPAWAHLQHPDHRLAASIRTSFSALWRGVEGVLLDEVLSRVHALRSRGLRLVLPMYDGLLLQVPSDWALQLAGAVETALRDALAVVGVPGSATVEVAATWAGAERRRDGSRRCQM